MAIEDSNVFYQGLRRYMHAVYGMAYSRVECVGRERIPTDGAVIMAPNHTNALMDALTVLTVTCRPTVFVARADIFRNPRVAKILNFFKIMPIMRMRDGMSNMKKNDEIMHKAVEVLRAGVPFGIFSEGTHRMKHSLLPLTKGIFRIALQCNDVMGGEKPVYIVPMGIEYGSYTRYRHSLAVEVGEAIDVSEFVRERPNLDLPEMMNALREELSGRMRGLFHCVPDDGDYEGVLELSYMRNEAVREMLGMSDSPFNRMVANRQTVRDVEEWKRRSPERTAELLDCAGEIAERRRKAGIDDESMYGMPTVGGVVMRGAVSVLLLPYALYCAVIDGPILLILWLLIRRLDDMALKNSFRFAVAMLLFPLILAAVAIVMFVCLPWQIALPLVVAAVPADMMIHDYVKGIRRVASDVKWMKDKRLRELRKRCGEILSKI